MKPQRKNLHNKHVYSLNLSETCSKLALKEHSKGIINQQTKRKKKKIKSTKIKISHTKNNYNVTILSIS